MYSWIAKISERATIVFSPPESEVMSKYFPRETFTRMFIPPSKGSFLFSNSRVTSPFLESCEKFLVKYSFTAWSVAKNDFFFFLSISMIIFSTFSFSLMIVSTFSWIDFTCSSILSKTSSALRFTFPRREILN